MAFPYVLALPEARAHLPKHVQLAQAVADDIAAGRLRAGQKLPGSRTLAETVGVHRNTVNAALAELAAQGWVETLPARGVFVRPLQLSESPRPWSPRVSLRAGIPERPRYALPAGPPLLTVQRSEQALLLTGGVADPRLFPRKVLAAAYRRALLRHGTRTLDYGSPFGAEPLRVALASMLSAARGLAASAENVLVTRGSQQGIWLSAHGLLQPGDRVGVEALGYPPAWHALTSAGAKLVPLAVDRDGVRIDAIEQALAEGPLRALYLTPHHQYPTMVPLSPARRLSLLALAYEQRIAILEDDYAHEFQFEGRPRLPLASTDSAGSVLYIGTLSKVLAPGLRIGYVVGPPALISLLAARRALIDRQGDSTSELVAAELLEEGELARHARRMRAVYSERRSVLAEVLQRELGERVQFELPQGGMNFWVRVRGTTPEGWAKRAAARGVLFRAGREMSLLRQKVPYVRMGFTRLDERELTRAVKEAALAF